MQIRCSHCHRPFAVGKEEVHAALDTLTEQELNHYTVYCPHCRRANRVSKEELHRAAPSWSKEESGAETET